MQTAAADGSSASIEFEAASRGGDLATLKRLFRTDPDLVDSKPGQANSLLVASASGQGRVFRWLKECGATCENNLYYTSRELQVAGISCQRVAVRLLTEIGAKWDWADEDLIIDLFNLARQRDENALLYLKSQGAPLDHTLKLLAIGDDYLECEMLMKLGVNGNLALLVCPAANALQSATVLLEYGADPNTKDHTGDTPLHECSDAYSFGKSDLLKIKIEDWAADAIAKVLIDYGADVNARNIKGETPLHLAASRSSLHPSLIVRLVDMLMQSGADIGATTPKRHSTALHLAASDGAPEIASVLIRAGASLKARDAFGMTPCDIAQQSNNERMVDALKS